MKKIILSLLIAMGLIGSASAQYGTTLTNGLVAYYPFNGNFNDYSGSGNHLIPSNSILGIDRFGNANSCLQVDNYYSGAVSINNIGISGNSDRTISLWIKPIENTSIYPFSYLLHWGKEGWDVGVGRSSYVIWQINQNANLHFGGWYSGSSISTTENITGTWNHIVVVYSNSEFNVSFYVNGALETNRFKTYTSDDDYHNITYLNTIDTPLDIGMSGGIKGFYDDVRIYNRALSSNEIAALYSYESDPGAQWMNYISQNLPTNSAFFSALAANTNFVSALASSITSNPQGFGIASVANLSSITFYNALAGAPSFITALTTSNPAFVNSLASNALLISDLTTNEGFIQAIAHQILAGTNNYGLAVKQAQSLSFPAIPTLTITPGKKYTNTVTASTALPVTQIVGNTAIASVSNNVLTILGSGSTTITASQAGNALYNPASASQPLIVNKGTQTLTFPAIASQTYASNKKVTLKTTSSAALTNTTYLIDNGAIGSISSNVVTLLGTGTATITATNSGNTYFAPAFATQKLIVH